MTLDEWRLAMMVDAERRSLPDLKPLLEALARATAALRGADWNEDARHSPNPEPQAPNPEL